MPGRDQCRAASRPVALEQREGPWAATDHASVSNSTHPYPYAEDINIPEHSRNVVVEGPARTTPVRRPSDTAMWPADIPRGRGQLNLRQAALPDCEPQMTTLSPRPSDTVATTSTWVLPSPESPGEARRQAMDWLTDRRHFELADTAALIVSELVTNAVRHGAGPVWCTLRILPGVVAGCAVRIEVGDHGRGWDGSLPQQAAPDGETCDGRGLGQVEALSSRWGAVRLPHGQLVWSELTTEAHHSC
ncbi:ATP-binding protein [Streptomyces sp. NPDC049597]|uniref:ATP-binding protein n=1 Tax=Streptomyces sp. NPDC049597 TaxID=3155276 RepID=UPI003440FF3F